MAGTVDPTRAQFKALMETDLKGPVWMLNLIRLRKKAKYEDGREASGAEAYAAYAKESATYFQAVGGKLVQAASPRAVVIGPDDERWDMAFIAEYPSIAAFAEMVKNPAYQATVHHRQAAVKDSRLIAMKPGVPGKVFG